MDIRGWNVLCSEYYSALKQLQTTMEHMITEATDAHLDGTRNYLLERKNTIDGMILTKMEL